MVKIMNEILLELKDVLNLISIKGLKSVSEDFRLNKIYSKIEILSKKSIVFNKMYVLLKSLIEDNRLSSFPEAINLINSIVYTQSEIPTHLKQSEVKVLEHTTCLNFIKYSSIIEIKEYLKSRSDSKWLKLKQIYDTTGLTDYRILENFLNNLETTYAYNKRFGIIDILSSYGKDIIPILLKRFNKAKNNSYTKMNIIQIISNVDAKNYNDYFKKWVQMESTYVAEIAIRALANDIENEEFMINYKPKNKVLKEAKFYTIAHYPTDRSKAFIKEIYEKDINVFKPEFEKVYHLIKDVVIDLLSDCFDKVKNFDCDNKKQVRRKEDILYSFYYILDCSKKYKDKIITDILIDMLKTETKLSYNKKIIALDLFNRGEQKALNYLATLKDKEEGYYLDISFISALKVFTKEKVFDEFSPIALKNFSSDSVGVMDIIKKILTYKVQKINPDCINCSSYNTCESVVKLENLNNQKIEITEDLYLTQLEKSKILWDKRWIEYMLENDKNEYVSYFISKDIDTMTKDRLKVSFIEALNKLKQSVPNKYYPTTTYDNYESTKTNIINIMLGLLITGAKDVAINNLVYFCYHLSTLYSIFYENLEPEDLVKLRQLEEDVSDLPRHIKTAIKEFVSQNRIYIVQKYNIKDK